MSGGSRGEIEPRKHVTKLAEIAHALELLLAEAAGEGHAEDAARVTPLVSKPRGDVTRGGRERRRGDGKLIRRYKPALGEQGGSADRQRHDQPPD